MLTQPRDLGLRPSDIGVEAPEAIASACQKMIAATKATW
jgi:hypothetical protein